MIKVIVDEFHRKIRLTTNLTARFLLFGLCFLIELHLLLQSNRVRQLLTGVKFIGDTIVTYVTVKLVHVENRVRFLLRNAVTDLMETGIATIAVEDLVDLLVTFSRKTNLTVCLEQRL